MAGRVSTPNIMFEIFRWSQLDRKILPLRDIRWKFSFRFVHHFPTRWTKSKKTAATFSSKFTDFAEAIDTNSWNVVLLISRQKSFAQAFRGN